AEALLQEPSIGSAPVGALAERSGAQRAELRAAEPPFLDEPRALQAGDVLRDGLLRDAEGAGQLADRRRPAREPLQDRAAGRVGGGRGGRAQWIHNRMVVNQGGGVKGWVVRGWGAAGGREGGGGGAGRAGGGGGGRGA